MLQLTNATRTARSQAVWMEDRAWKTRGQAHTSVCVKYASRDNTAKLTSRVSSHSSYYIMTCFLGPISTVVSAVEERVVTHCRQPRLTTFANTSQLSAMFTERWHVEPTWLRQ